MIVVLAFDQRGPWLAPLGVGVGLWLIWGPLTEIAYRVELFGASGAESWRRARNLPRAAFGGALAHAGVGVMVIGLVPPRRGAPSASRRSHPGTAVDIAGYHLVFEGVTPRQGPNYSERVGKFVVSRGGGPVTTLEPSKRAFAVEKSATTEAGIHNSWRGDLYVVLGDELKGGAYSVRVYFNPMVRLIWIGALIMFLGGGVSLSDRRLRVGAPKRARTKMTPAPAAK